MVSQEMMEISHMRLENIIAYELALECRGKNIYDIPTQKRAIIHASYKTNSCFWWDVNQLVKLGLLPKMKSRKDITLVGLLKQTEALAAEGVNIFAMNRTELAERLGVWHTTFCRQANDLAATIESKYGKRPAFAVSRRGPEIKKETINVYDELIKTSPQLLPAASELADAMDRRRTTVICRIKRYGLELSNTAMKQATIKRWREILTLENTLARQDLHLFVLPDEALKKYFPNYSIALLRNDFDGIYDYVQVRLNYLAENGKALTTEAKEIQKFIAAFRQPH
ncbi:MAG TPA: hypothetical protein HA224_04660 [Nanoarchaeota archaeon]|nr:hypothetical protein [Nanoarchaeota archaeon]